MSEPLRSGLRHAVLLVVGLFAVLLAPPLAASQRFAASGDIELAFTPEHEAEAALLRFIGEAKKSLRVQIYIFTSKRIAEALVAAHRRGVDVQVLADGHMNRKAKGNALPVLLAGGVPVAMDTAYNAAHNKVIIADAGGGLCGVLTGSYNFTWSAQHKNAENLLILRGNCPLAKAYADNWQRHRQTATVLRKLPFKSTR